MSSLIVVYSPNHEIEAPPRQHLPSDTRISSMTGIATVTEENMETILRMLLKQLAAEAE